MFCKLKLIIVFLRIISKVLSVLNILIVRKEIGSYKIMLFYAFLFVGCR